MFRFIHAADAHIDSPLRGLEAHEDAPVERIRGATRHAFENLIQLAIDKKVDFLVLAGDLYDGDWKDYSTGLFLRRQLSRLDNANIPVFMISGNHDAESVITRSLSLPDYVFRFSTRKAESKEVPDLPVVIHGRGFPNRQVPENLVADYPDAVPNAFNLGLLHTSLTGASGHDTYAPCSVADLEQKGYDYWALGHVHQPAVISERPWIVFPGNCQGRHVRETGPRGCCLVTVDDTLQVTFFERHDLDVVRWDVLDVDLNGVQEKGEALERVSQSMSDAVESAGGRLVAARVVFHGATDLHGSLHHDMDRWQNEVLARAYDQGEDAFWLEQVKVKTKPIYDLQKLAERDSLTQVVIETLDDVEFEKDGFPKETIDMLKVLPPEVRKAVEEEWGADADDSVITDVRAIILDALAGKEIE